MNIYLTVRSIPSSDLMKTETKPENQPFKEYYIQPILNIVDEFADINDPDAFKRYFYRRDLPFEDHISTILESRTSFIIGEPGYGKSRLIQELCKHTPGDYVRFDCRDLDPQQGLIVEQNIKYLFFDGLDEVAPVAFLGILDSIRSIIASRPDCSVSIACRTHYLERAKSYLVNFKGAKYVQVTPFNHTQIWRYLLNYFSNIDIADAIYYRSRSISGTSVLQTPRYLEAFVKAVLNENISREEIRNMATTEIFERVIYFQLRTELKKAKESAAPLKEKKFKTTVREVLSYIKASNQPKENSNELYITQRVLEKLAFVMEVYQRTRITMQELVTFLDNTESNINLIFLQYSSVDKFIERTLKKTNDTVSFEHSSFQEYLAAKELVRMGDSAQVIYDLILEKDLQLIYPNWLDVLQYAIELDAEKIAGALCNFLSDNVSRQFDEKLVNILMGPGIERASNITKGRLFNTIFKHYQLSGRYLYQKNDALAVLFAGPADISLLAVPDYKDFDTNNIRQLTNLILMISSLNKIGVLPSELHECWKTFIMDHIQNGQLKNEYEILFFGLEHLEAFSEIRGLGDFIVGMDDGHIAAYLDTLSRIGPDQSLPFFLKIVSGRPNVKRKDRFLDSMKTEAGIVEILQLLINDETARSSIFNHHSSSVEFYSLPESIRELKSDPLLKLIEKTLYALSGDEDYVDYPNNLGHLMERLVAYLLVDSKNFMKRLLQRPNFEEIIQETSEPFALNMSEAQFKSLFQALSKQRRGNFLLTRLISHLKVTGIPERKKLLDKLRASYPMFFHEHKVSPKEMEEAEQMEKEKLYRQFEKRLMKGTADVQQSVYKFYFDNKEKLQDLVTSDDIKKMTDIVRSVVDRVKPESFKVRIERQGSTVNYNVNDTSWYNFGYFLNAAIEFGMEDLIARNRRKIILHLPMMNEKAATGYGHPGKFAKLIGTVTPEEVSDLLAFCTNRNDDYLYSAVSSFTDFIAANRLYVFKPILKEMLAAPLPEIYEKEAILKVIGTFSENQDDILLLKAIEKDFDPDDESKWKLGNLANSILITQFGDEESMGWRFSQLKSRLQAYPTDPYSRDEGLRPYPEWEIELDDPKFGKCLEGINSELIRMEMAGLLRFSLEVRRNPDYIRYSSYIQRIISGYFSSINSLSVIREIRSIVDDPKYKDTANSFKEYLRTIEINYTGNVLLYKTISEPVKKFNYLRTRKYLSIDDSHALVAVVDLALEDLKSFVNDKGYYMPARQLSGSIQRGAGKPKLFNEDILQKTLKVELENSLLRRGFRNTDILREVSIYDDKRLDLYIKYGFIGPVIAELKLLHNDEIQDMTRRAVYKEKLIQYRKSVNAEYIYYIVFDVRKPDRATFEAYEEMVREYQDIKGLQCVYIPCPHPDD
ncbi:NACHT domain-containing protein [Mucilaginibacter kameinonensis]|uniref:NACHT domain-containing protein n=1 Tax=Mucilaginibacter kameinonensis TaxID=452286 RepID=UPI0013CED699|nr:hypothetical protein [Mucilaginibacter kameinonensis]